MATCQELLQKCQQEFAQLFTDQIITLGPKQCDSGPPGPKPANLLYDSNLDIDWSKVDPKKKYTEFGNIRTRASGHPVLMFFPETKEIALIHQGKYGRAYFHVPNYQSRLEVDMMLDSCSNGFSAKIRNRHQFHEVDSKAPDEKAQGGVGCGIRCTDVDDDIEVAHNLGEDSGPSKGLRTKLVPNKYYHVSFAQWNTVGKQNTISILVKIDGEIVNSGDIKTAPQFFNEAEFLEWSEFWIRYNAKKGGKLMFKNLQLYNIGIA